MTFAPMDCSVCGRPVGVGYYCMGCNYIVPKCICDPVPGWEERKVADAKRGEAIKAAWEHHRGQSLET